MRLLHPLLVGGWLLVGAYALPANALMIDVFEDPSAQALPSLETGLSGVLGTTRGMAASFGAPFNASGGVAGGMLDVSFSAQAGSTGFAVASYVGQNAQTQLGGVDVTDGGQANRFALEILSLINTGPEPDLWLLVTDSDGTMAGGLVSLATPGIVDLSFDDIMAGTGVLPSGGDGALDLSSVDAIQMRLSTSGGSFTIQADNLQTIPEPLPGALLLFALAGLGLRAVHSKTRG